MKQINHKPLSRNRVEELLDCYGAASHAWPEQEREAALRLLGADPALQRYRDEVAQLDQLIDADRALMQNRVNPQEMDALARKILSGLPERPAVRSTTQSHVRSSRTWFGAMAASVLVAAIAMVVLMNTPQTGVSPASQVAYSEFDQYANWEVFGDEAAADANESAIFPLIALAEPDLLQ